MRNKRFLTLLVVFASIAPAQEKSGGAGGSGGPASFSAITAGTFSGGALVIGTAGSLGSSGSGTITATGLSGAATGASLALTGGLTTGSAGGATGAIDLKGATSGSIVTMTVGASTGAGTVTIPGVTTTLVGGGASLTTAGGIACVSATNGIVTDSSGFKYTGSGGTFNIDAKIVLSSGFSGGVASLQNISSSQYTAVDLLDNAAALQGFFGWGNSGSAVPSAFYFGTANNNPVYVYTSNTKRWTFNGSGHFLAATDNSLDIGASGATRPRTGYFGTSLVSPIVNATTNFQVNGTDGITASGAACTITAITGGIITAGSCT